LVKIQRLISQRDELRRKISDDLLAYTPDDGINISGNGSPGRADGTYCSLPLWKVENCGIEHALRLIHLGRYRANRVKADSIARLQATLFDVLHECQRQANSTGL
jgi:hypothetical protein